MTKATRPATLTAETKIALKPSQFWSVMLVVSGGAAFMTAQSVNHAALRADHDAEVAARIEADKQILADQKELAQIMLDLRIKAAASNR